MSAPSKVEKSSSTGRIFIEFIRLASSSTDPFFRFQIGSHDSENILQALSWFSIVPPILLCMAKVVSRAFLPIIDPLKVFLDVF